MPTWSGFIVFSNVSRYAFEKTCVLENFCEETRKYGYCQQMEGLWCNLNVSENIES